MSSSIMDRLGLDGSGSHDEDGIRKFQPFIITFFKGMYMYVYMYV